MMSLTTDWINGITYYHDNYYDISVSKILSNNNKS